MPLLAPVAADLTFDVGVLWRYTAGVWTRWGVSRGGVRVSEGPDVRDVEFDGRRARVAGQQRIVAWVTRIAGTFLELSTANTEVIEHGVTSVLASGVRTVTPRAAGALFPAGAYLGIRLDLRRGDGGVLRKEFASAVRVEYSIESADPGEAGIALAFEARQPWSAS